MKKNKGYYLCSETVIDYFPEAEHSRYFKSGYKNDNNKYCIAFLNYDEIKSFYDQMININEVDNKLFNFWLRECTSWGGTDPINIIDISNIQLDNIKTNGLFVEFERATHVITGNDRAKVIFELASSYHMNPIEFIDNLYINNK